MRVLAVFAGLVALVGGFCYNLSHRVEAAGLQGGLAGAWEGTIEVAGVSLAMRVVIVESDQGLSATIDIPQQSAAGLRLGDVRRDGPRVHFELATGAAPAVFNGTLSGDDIKGTFTQGPARGTFTLKRAVAAPATPAGPPPYREEEVVFTNGDVTLAGTLTLPSGDGPFPAVVLITGSGAQNRDEEVFGFKVFRELADGLTRHGIAVLRHDDRGVGGSTGNITQATTADFGDDALAGLAMLAARPDVARGQVGLAGHSEGAIAAAIAASKSPDVAFVVMLAGTGVRGDDVLRQQARDAARDMGATGEEVAEIVAAHRRTTEAALSGASREDMTAAAGELIRAQVAGLPAAQRAAIGDIEAFVAARTPGVVQSMQSPWMRFMLAFDPTTALRKVTCPVLAVFGGKDTQVRPSLNRAPVEAALAQNARAKVVEYPAANHLFQEAGTGQVAEYATLPRAFVAGLVDAVAGWIREAASGR